jgi:hypothetical protein
MLSAVAQGMGGRGRRNGSFAQDVGFVFSVSVATRRSRTRFATGASPIDARHQEMPL